MKNKLSYSKLLSLAVTVFSLPLVVFAVTTPVSFSDVPTNHPNYSAIMELKAQAIISGYPDGTFKPAQAVNRVEALKILLLGSAISVDTNQVFLTNSDNIAFQDVGKSQWFAPYVLKSKELNIVQGYPDGTFKPAQTVNLVENLKMLILTNDVDVSNVMVMDDPYSDAPKDQWYAKYVQYAKDKKLIEADASGKIYPSKGMTRAKLAEVMFRLIAIQKNGLDFYGQVKVAQTQENQQQTQQPQPTQQQTQQQPPANPNALNVSIQNFAFNKSEMTIAVGTTVRWTNKDAVAHTVTSDSLVFDSGNMPNGAIFEYTFNTEGTFPYRCVPHPSMQGTITVKPAIQVPTI